MGDIFKTVGTRKVGVAIIYFLVNALLVACKSITPDVYQYVAMTLIAAFFGANSFENKKKESNKPDLPAA